MTKEQYEGTPELIFYCEYNPNDFEDRLEIPFTNEYDIKLDFSRDEETKEICINVDLQPKEPNIPKDFFGKNILNVTAIAGKNGVGKTNVIRRACADAEILNLESIKLYLLDDKLYADTSNNEQIIINISSVSSYGGTAKALVIASTQFPEQISRKGFLKKFSATNTEDSLYRILSRSRDQINLAGFSIPKSQPITVNLYDIRGWFDEKHMFNPYQDQLEGLGIELKATDINNSNVKENFLSYSILKFIYESIVLQGDQNFSQYIGEIVNGCNNRDDLLKNLMQSNYLFFDDRLKVENSRVVVQNNKTKLNDLYQLLKKIDKNRYFVAHGQLKLNIDNPTDEERKIFHRLVWELTGLKNGYDMLTKIFSLDLGGYSSGEKFLLKSFAFLEDVLDESARNFSGKFNSVIILLDEYEQHLHPEWSRKYLSDLLKFLDAQSEILGTKFQVILTTHSPYLISDLPKENIVLIKKNKMGKRKAGKSNYGFSSNYYDIMSDSFFLDDTIGEFAKQKINGWLKEIKDISASKDNFENKNEKLDQIKENLSIIGDEFLRHELIKQVNFVKDNIFNGISNVDKIAFLEKQIIELKGKEHDD